ncbi:MAG: bifunctional RNase H/acid phosphatase, partial [Candidatus Nanopelagicales bacterium]|nr:bifunctional RNase H/acid phosphatase [Candidatus Nanopelagicales bacterium]
MARQFIVEADGGSRGNPGPAAYGTVVRDAATGAVLAELAEYIGIATNNVAEYRGALAGLTHVRALDPEAVVEVRLDSKLVVEQMSGRWKIKHPDMRDLALQARAVLAPGRVTYTWVPRAANAAADALVNEILDQAGRGDRTAIARLTEAPPSVTSSQDVVGEAEEAFAHGAVREAPNRLIGWQDVGQPTTTVLVRHGATAFSLEKRFSGRGGQDLGLSALGLAQAEAAAEELVHRGPLDAVIASPLLRSRETAACIAGRFGLEVEVIDDLAECSFGEWDGHTFADVQGQWPEAMQRWLDSVEVAPPGGESFAQVRERVDRGLRTVITR